VNQETSAIENTTAMAPPRPQTIAVTGASGLIGGLLCERLEDNGHCVLHLVRRESVKSHEIEIPRGTGRLGIPRLSQADVVVHLAGERISGRWSSAKKQRIRQSRVDGTRRLAQALSDLPHPPAAFICASAIGYYGDGGDEMLTEGHGSGEGFLAGVCRDWEAACQPARTAGIRVVNARFGVVLSPRNGALTHMLKLFKRNLGAELGKGHQYVSWVSEADVVGALMHIIKDDRLSGPVNVTAPTPVTNRELTKHLLKYTGKRPAPRIPAPMVRLIMGEMGQELMLNSQRVIPTRLLDSGYSFEVPFIEDLIKTLPELQ